MRVGGQTLARVATLIHSHPRLTGPLKLIIIFKIKQRCKRFFNPSVVTITVNTDVYLSFVYHIVEQAFFPHLPLGLQGSRLA